MKCPNCGTEVRARAKIGEGTAKAKNMEVNNNRHQILRILKEFNKPLSVNQVNRVLKMRSIKRESPRNTGWNYHTVQTDLSNLIGIGIVKMVKISDDYFDEEGGWTTRIVPKYEIK